MRWGAFGSWHCGHNPVLVAVRASCVRRLAVRVLECRRFGLGIVLASLDRFERRETRILPFRCTRALALIEVGTALRAQAATTLLAQRLHWQREIKLLAHQLVEVNLIVAVIARL